MSYSPEFQKLLGAMNYLAEQKICIEDLYLMSSAISHAEFMVDGRKDMNISEELLKDERFVAEDINICAFDETVMRLDMISQTAIAKQLVSQHIHDLAKYIANHKENSHE